MTKKRKLGKFDPKPPAVIIDESSIIFPSLEDAEELWKNDIWKWYLSYHLSQDGAYLQILK